MSMYVYMYMYMYVYMYMYAYHVPHNMYAYLNLTYNPQHSTTIHYKISITTFP